MRRTDKTPDVRKLRVPVRRAAGFTLMELMITIGIVAILARIALPAYMSFMIKARRSAAEACLANFADYMERYYATNMTYATVTVSNLSGLGLDCASSQNTGAYYSYAFASSQPTATTFTLTATPLSTSSQANDAQCATLQLDQLGNRTDTGTGTAATCWRQ